MLTYAIETKEKRDVVTVDIPGFFLQAKSKDNPTLRLDGQMAEALVEIDSSYKKFITFKGKKQHPVIYGRAEQNIYGTLDAAMIYCQIFSKYVVDVLEFELNPYDACVAGWKSIYNTMVGR